MKTPQKSLYFSFVFPLLSLELVLHKRWQVPLFLCHSLGKFNFWSILSSLLSLKERVSGGETRMLLSSSSFVKLLFYSFESTTPKGVKKIKFFFLAHCPKAKLSIQIAKGIEKPFLLTNDDKKGCISFKSVEKREGFL